MSAGFDPELLMQFLGQGGGVPGGLPGAQQPPLPPGLGAPPGLAPPGLPGLGATPGAAFPAPSQQPAPPMGVPQPPELGMGPQQPPPMEELFDPGFLQGMSYIDSLDYGVQPPFEPEALPREAPDPNQIRGLIEDTVLLWGPRDRRMDADLRMYRMEVQDAAGKGAVVLKNTPFVIVEKIANMIAGHAPMMEMLSATEDQRELAERIEKFLFWWWDVTNTELRTSQLYGSLNHILAWFLAQRGWAAGRMHLDPDATGSQDNPVKLTVYDPRTVYPQLGRKGGLRYVVHRYTQSIGELVDEWGEFAIEAGFATKDPTDSVEVEAYYDDWWHCVFADRQIIKPLTPHEYGYVPWIIAIGNGSPVRMSESDQSRWTEEVGVSSFHGIRQTYLYINKILSQMAVEVERSANPAMIYYWDPSFGPKPQKLETAPGAVNYLVYDRERADPIQLTTAPRDADALLDSFVDDLQKGGLPSVLWGTGGNVSGFEATLMSHAARDQVYAILEGIQFFKEAANEMCLKMIRDWWEGSIGFWVQDRAGQWRGGATITAAEIHQCGTKTRVRYKDISPRDRIQMAQTGMAMREAGLLDDVTFLEDYAGHDNPYDVLRRARADFIYRDEDFMREVEVPLDLYYTDYNKFQWYMAYLERKKSMEYLQAMAGTLGPQVQGPPGFPQMPTPPQGPPGLPGQSPEAVPPQLQPGADPLAMMLGASVGGVGAGSAPGVPGVPGTSVSPLPIPITG